MRGYRSFFRRNRLSGGLSRTGVGWGGVQYRGPGIFHPRGVSICTASAGSDITRCNSARGIIDLSVGSRQQSGGGGGGEGGGVCATWAVFPQIGTSCLVLENSHFHRGDLRGQGYVDGPASEQTQRRRRCFGERLCFRPISTVSLSQTLCCGAWSFLFTPLEGALCGGVLTCWMGGLPSLTSCQMKEEEELIM